MFGKMIRKHRIRKGGRFRGHEEKHLPLGKGLIPLNNVSKGTVVKLGKIAGGSYLKKRLIELGFVENEPIKVLKEAHHGPLLVEIKGSRFAIGWGEAQKIFVYQS